MSNLRQAAQQALEALQWSWGGEPIGTMELDAITALRAALAEPLHAPMAWMCADESLVHKGYSRFSRTCEGDWNIPVYTAPPQRKPLTDEQCVSIFREAFLAHADPMSKDNMTIAFASASGPMGLELIVSNLWFNVRFGTRHFQWSRDWEITFKVNPYFVENPPQKWFEVYCLFGKHF